MDIEGLDVVWRELLILSQSFAVLEDPARGPKLYFIVGGYGQVVFERVVKAIEAAQENGLVKPLASDFG